MENEELENKEDLRNKAEDNRKNSESVKGLPSLPHNKVYMESLVNGEDSIKKKGTDLAFDAIPTLLAFIMANKSANSNGRRAAKLREAADSTDYSSIDPKLLLHAEGSATNPTGPLQRTIYKEYNKPVSKAVNKATKNYQKSLTDVLIELKRNGTLDIEKDSKIIDEITKGTYKLGSSENGDKIYKAINKYINSVDTSAQKVIDDNVKLLKNNKGKLVVDKPSGDRSLLNTPIVLDTLGGVSLANNIAKATQLFDDELTNFSKKLDEKMVERAKRIYERAMEKGKGYTYNYIKSNNMSLDDYIKAYMESFDVREEDMVADTFSLSPIELNIPSLTNVLDYITKEGWRYNKKDVITELNKAYDKVLDIDDENKTKKAIEIYANIDVNNKTELISGLKQMLLLLQ